MADLRNVAPDNLPASLTSFVGRRRELAEVARLLGECRLLTLTGEGGCGKSRLALETVRVVLKRFAHGAWIVELAALSDATLVPQAVARVLEVPEQPHIPMTATLGRTLRSKAILLILDNCEHLLGACAQLAGVLLRECPGLRILVASREPLGVPGETTWRVPSLSTPELQHLPPHDQLAEFEAVRLFSDRARSMRPEFRITAGNAGAVAQTCRRLDGMPLAIELAAARIRTLTVDQIAARLDDRFRLLTGGGPTVLPRHQTLRATMDWSYDLLSEAERIVLRRLSVFAGGWTLEAAEAVCGGEGIETTEVLDVLASLVAKSLVNADTQGSEARYWLLETTRQYARDRLEESIEAARVRRRHRDWYLALAQRAQPHRRGPEQRLWLTRLEREHDNLRAGLDYSQREQDGAETELRFTEALAWFWIVHGHWSEGRTRLEGALSRNGDVLAPALPRALESAAFLAERQGDFARAVTLAEKTLAVSKAMNDRYGIADALIRLGSAALHQGSYERAMALCEQSLAICREIDVQGDVALALAIMGNVARSQGNLERADAAYTECLVTSQRVGEQSRAAYALRGLAVVALARGDSERALTLYAQSLTLSKELGFRMITEGCLEGLAGVACARGQYRRGALLLGAAEVLRESLGLRPMPVDQAAHEARMALARGALGEKSFAEALAEGRAMTLNAAIESALALQEKPPSAATGPENRRAGRQKSVLTAREREVVVLIAEGLSNREIASRLVIAERTAEGHVQSILNKLGFKSRAQTAAWARTALQPGHPGQGRSS